MISVSLPFRGALITIIIGLVFQQLVQCCAWRVSHDDSKHRGCPKIIVPSLSNVVTAKSDFGTLATNAPPPLIPPYLLEELRIRSHNDPSIIATINETAEIEKAGFCPLAGNGSKANAKVEIYDAKGEEKRPGEKARFEGDKPAGDKEVNACYEFSLKIRRFYKDVHARNSIDDKGMKMVSTVNFGKDFNNAFWDGMQMTYGRPGDSSPFKSFVLLDIAGHEVTHGVTEKDTHLKYYGQAGALNESLSDVFGALIVQHSKHQSADRASWLSGEGIWKKGIKGRALRDMLNPGQAYDDPKVGKDPQPAHMKDYIKTSADNGGVHYNSGIPNKAFATFATSIGGFAWEKPGRIWYKARTLAGRNPSFAQFAYHTLAAAKELGYNNDLKELRNAWKAVGVTASATAPDKDTPKFGEDNSSKYQSEQ